MRIQSVKQSPNFEAKGQRPHLDLSHVTDAKMKYVLRGQRGGQKPSAFRQFGAKVWGIVSRRLSS